MSYTVGKLLLNLLNYPARYNLLFYNKEEYFHIALSKLIYASLIIFIR